MIFDEICIAIKRNPKINRVIVDQWDYEQLQDEFEDMQFIKEGPPEQMTIMGRPILKSRA